MSLAENLLNSLGETRTASPEQEPHIIVGADRFIKVPDQLKKIAVTNDKDIETVHFDCVRYWDGYDLSTFAIYLNIALPNGAGTTYIPKNITTSENFYHFDWVIEGNITPKSGTIGIGITAIKTKTNENGEIVTDKRWNSFPNTECSIVKGFDIENVPSEEESSDVIAQITAILEEIQTILEEIVDANKYDVEIPLTITGEYVEGSPSKTWHNIKTGSDCARTDYVPIQQGYKYVKAQVYANEYVFPILFFDSNKNAIYEHSVIGDKRTTEPYIAKIPSDAEYVVVSEWHSTVDGVTPKAYFTTGEDLNKNGDVFQNCEFSLFKQWGIVGDSLSVGHTTDTDGNASSPNLYYSWGQYLARSIGNTCLNFGRSGVSAKSWMTDDNGYKKLIQANNLCQCYILALGANDANYTLGSIADVDFANMNNNADTEYGWYAKVINAIRTTAPLAPIFLFTLPYPRNTDANIQAINNMIRELAANPNLSMVYLVDLDADYNDYFATGKLYNCIGNTGWHLTALGYLYASKVNEMAISKVMADNYADFQNVFEIPYGETGETPTTTTTETWTFELEDGSTVTKKVVLA